MPFTVLGVRRDGEREAVDLESTRLRARLSQGAHSEKREVEC